MESFLPHATTAVLVAVAETPGLPRAGAQLLASHRSHEVRSGLARCEDLDEEVRTELVHDRSVHVRRHALRHTTRADELQPDADAFVEELVGVAGNPQTPSGVLGALSRHRSERVVREVLANPSTPREVAVDAARRWSIPDLYARGNTYHHLAGAGQVVRAHPEVIEVWAQGPATPGLQALASSPHLAAEPARALLVSTRSREVRRRIAENLAVPDDAVVHAGAHQRRRDELRSALAGRSVADLLAGPPAARYELVSAGSRTFDEQLLAQEALEPEVAAALVAREKPGCTVDPHALALVAERLGDEVHEHARHLSGSNRLAAALLSPVMARSTQRHHLARATARQVHRVLGESSSGWEAFVGLMPHWEADVVSLAETAAGI